MKWFIERCANGLKPRNLPQHESNLENIKPPWVVFPDRDEPWGDWRQGEHEGWLRDVFMPFWSPLSNQERLAYLESWDTNGIWREYLMMHWSESSICISSEVAKYRDGIASFSKLKLAVIGVSNPPATMRWYVSAECGGFGAYFDNYLIYLADFDRFCSDLKNCVSLGEGEALLSSYGDEKFSLEISTNEQDANFTLRCTLSRTIIEDKYREVNTMRSEFNLGMAALTGVANDLISLRADPQTIQSLQLLQSKNTVR